MHSHFTSYSCSIEKVLQNYIFTVLLNCHIPYNQYLNAIRSTFSISHLEVRLSKKKLGYYLADSCTVIMSNSNKSNS